MHARRCRFALAAMVASLVALAGCSEDLPTRPGAVPAPEAAPRRNVEPYTGQIRIGVVPSASTVQVGATASYEVREKGTDALLLTGAANEVVTVSWTSSASVTTESRRLQVVCTSSATDRDRRLADGAAAGFPTASEWISAAGCWRVYVGERPLPIDTAAERAYKNNVIAAGQATADAFWRTVTLTQTLPRYVVTRGNGTQVLSANPPRVVPSTGQVLIAGQKYRGTAEVQLNSQSLLAGINELPMEQYLYGVVPKELGPVTYPEVEAQRAQAIAARTYAHANLGKRWSDGYDLGATVSDQVYGGFSAEHSVSTAAVNATAGLVATYNGALIDALFHATSGGHTAHSEDVFSGTLAYLRGVWDYPAGAQLSSTSALLADLRNPTSTTSYEAWHHWHRWNFTWTNAEISSVISTFAGRSVGKVLAINVVSRSATGRVTQIEYVTEAGTFYDTKGRIRSSLKYINASGNPTLLPSTLFVIERNVNGSGQTTGYTVYGGGNGHGIGMSQTGAVGMARAGHTYPQILKKYYSGIVIEQKVGTRG